VALGDQVRRERVLARLDDLGGHADLAGAGLPEPVDVEVDVGVPPEVVQAGKDTLAVYLLTQPHTTKEWVASFYGTTHPKIDRYVRWVTDRAEEIRETARERGVE
jgi:hypothetical protein